MHSTNDVFDMAFSLLEFVSKLNWCKYKYVGGFSFTSVISQQKCQKEGFCRTIVTLLGFSWKWINWHVKHAKNCVTHLPNLENTVNDYLT